MENLKSVLYEKFNKCSDFSIREIGNNCRIYYLKRLCDKDYISEKIIKSIINSNIDNTDISQLVFCRDIEVCKTIEAAVFGLLHGNAVLEIIKDDYSDVYLCNSDIPSGRTVNEPDTDVTIHGSHAGFVESLDANLTEIRKIIRTENLKIENLLIGKETKTSAALIYLDNVIKEDVLANIKNALNNLELRSGVNSDSIKLSLSGKNKLFPIIGSYEKPDIISSKLLGGRAALIVDGSPFVLTFPYVFVESIQSPEDYTKSNLYATFLRLLRIFGLIIAVYLPAIIVAAIYHNKRLLPFETLFAITSSRNGVAFGIFGELIISLIIFEIIREVGQRMPKAVGDAVGIVASIILGDAAVKAGISSMVVIMIVSLCAVSTFIVPIYKDTTVILRFVFLIFAYGLSFYGIFLLNFILLFNFVEKRSFGVRYMTPIFDSNGGINDFILTLPEKVIKRGDKGIAKDK